MMISYVYVFLVLLESVVISIVAKNQESFFGGCQWNNHIFVAERCWTIMCLLLNISIDDASIPVCDGEQLYFAA